jgi:Tfp pilus assembly protein PilV
MNAPLCDRPDFWRTRHAVRPIQRKTWSSSIVVQWRRSVPRKRIGLTLLELMLSMALTAVILVAIGMAIDLHLRMVDSRRSTVENAQVARAILNQIADDLRSTIQQTAGDMSGTAQMVDDVLENSDELASAAAALGVEDAIPDTGELSDMSTDIASATSVPTVAGLYGNQYELQIDVSRLPRVDEFQRLLSPDAIYTIQDIPSDVKTVAYYVRDGNRSPLMLSGLSTGNQIEQAGGLVRRELDRAVTLYAEENANLSGLQDVGDVIAPEVIAIEFEYFDGLEWLVEWDSELEEGLPMAVRITLMIGDMAEDAVSNPLALSTANLTPELGREVYSLVVRLPTAEYKAEEETTSSDGLDSVGL